MVKENRALLVSLQGENRTATLNMFVAAGTYPVWLSYDGTKKLVHPRAEVVRAIDAPYANHRPGVVAEARAWLKKYDVD